MIAIRNTFIAGLATTAMIAGSSLATPSQAHAGGKLLGALVGGVVVGSILGAASARAQANYGVVYTPNCWNQNQFRGYDVYGNAVYQTVRVCQ